MICIWRRRSGALVEKELKELKLNDLYLEKAVWKK